MKNIIPLVSLVLALFSCGKSENKSDVSCCSKVEIDSCKTVDTKISDASIFNLSDNFTTQDGKSFTLPMLQGKPTVVGMVFTHCAYACPRLTADMLSIADSLLQHEVNYLLVSFDVARDTAERLKFFAKKQGLTNNWTLLHGSDEAVRTLSVLLNVQYEQDATGNFSHSNIVSVLDKQGVLQYQKEGLGENHSQTIAIIKKLAEQP